jgi:hypothetical protein
MDNEPKQPDLLPCPHCGAPGEVVEMSAAFNGTPHPFASKAKCTDCHHSVVGNSLEACFAKSAQSWNKRSAHPDLARVTVVGKEKMDQARSIMDRMDDLVSDVYMNEHVLRSVLRELLESLSVALLPSATVKE